MNERIKKMIERFHEGKFPLCIEKFRIATKTLAQTEGEPQIIRRAKITANVLDGIPIFIEEDQRIVGSGASKPKGLEIDYEYGAWQADEIKSLKEENYTITPEDEAELQEINRKFGDKSLVVAVGEVFGNNERLWPFMKSGLVLPPWKSKKEGSGGGYAQSGLGLGPGFYLVAIDFSKIISGGSNKLIAEAEEELKNLRYYDGDAMEKEYFLKATIIVHKAFIRLAHRYADLAAEMALKESNPVRKKELERIAETCRWVPANPARNFYEAAQAFWFTFLLISPSPTSAGARFDQYMYPAYKKDKEAGTITDAEVLEILEELRVHDMKLNRTSGMANRKKNAGMAKWHNWTIGGMTSDGKDATNELTYLVLEAALDTKLPHNTITLRVHENTPEKLMVKALEVVKSGIGMPAFVSDKSYINFFTRNGMAVEDAREYVMTGCLDGNIWGQTRTIDVTMFIVALAFEIFMHNGYCPRTQEQVGIETGDVLNFKTYAEFEAAFKKQLAFLLSMVVEKNNIDLIAMKDLFPDPFRSSLMKDALKVGKDLGSRAFTPFDNGSIVCSIGTINVADSLAVIKKLIFEEKKITMKQLQDALAADWKGYEDLRTMCMKDVPKYGNDNDYVDLIAADLYQYMVDVFEEYKNVYGGKQIVTAISITSHQPGGMFTGATPDGRHAGEILADGSMSPMQGVDTHGPTGVFKSAMKIKQDPYQATLLNMKFDPSGLKTDSDLQKLAAMIKVYFNNGGKQVQFNVVDKETLVAAQETPEKYRDLVVRVAGYSAYFNALGKMMQDEIIDRTGHSL